MLFAWHQHMYVYLGLIDAATPWHSPSYSIVHTIKSGQSNFLTISIFWVCMFLVIIFLFLHLNLPFTAIPTGKAWACNGHQHLTEGNKKQKLHTQHLTKDTELRNWGWTWSAWVEDSLCHKTAENKSYLKCEIHIICEDPNVIKKVSIHSNFLFLLKTLFWRLLLVTSL